MTSNGSTKIILTLVALFLLGGVCGYALSNHRTERPPTQPGWEEHWIAMRQQEDIQRLNLTPEQIEQARATYEQLAADIRKVRELTAKGIFRAVSAQGRALSEHLTPEQREEFKKLTEERRARFPRR